MVPVYAFECAGLYIFRPRWASCLVRLNFRFLLQGTCHVASGNAKDLAQRQKTTSKQDTHMHAINNTGIFFEMQGGCVV